MHWALARIYVEHHSVDARRPLGLREHLPVHGYEPDEILLSCQQLGFEPRRRLHSHLNIVHGRDHDHLDQAVVLTRDLEHLETVDTGPPDVEQYQVDVLLLEDGECLFPGRDHAHTVIAFENGG